MANASQPSREREIFEQALDIESAEERERFLQGACRDEPALLVREAVAMQKKLLDSEHPSVANALGNLAHVLEREGNLQEAESLQREAVAIRRKKLGAQHPVLGMSLYELGIVLNKRGNLPEAETMLREALAMANKFPGNDYVNPTNVLADLNKVLAAQGKHTETNTPTDGDPTK